MKKLIDYKIILASNSPRRKDLLAYIVPEFKVKTMDVEEIYPKSIKVTKVAEYLACLKASPFNEKIKDDELIITADTIVVLGDVIFGKPTNRENAVYILQQLSGKKHKVITGVCLKTKNKEISFSNTTYVYFKDLSNEEIHYYIDKFKPYDKAGAYAIQEWIGFIGVEKIEGDYNNIVGLPVQELYNRLLTL